MCVGFLLLRLSACTLHAHHMDAVFYMNFQHSSECLYATDLTAHVSWPIVLSYPSGQPAIVTVPWNENKPYEKLPPTDKPAPKPTAFYTLVFENDPEKTMLGVFTPHGRCCAYHPDGKEVRYMYIGAVKPIGLERCMQVRNPCVTC